MRILCLLLALASSALPSLAFAQVSMRAQRSYEEGRRHYRAGRYEEAAVALERAHAADPDAPVLIYNLARVYELLAQHERSLMHYRRYLGMVDGSSEDDAAERERARQAIARVEGAAERARVEEAEQRAAEEARLARVEAEARRQALRETTGRADGAFYGTLLAGGGLLVTGLISGIRALQLDNESDGWVLPDDASLQEYRKQQRQARRLAIMSDLTLVAGAALGLTALLLYYMRSSGPSSEEAQAEVAFAPRPGGGMLWVGGRL